MDPRHGSDGVGERRLVGSAVGAGLASGRVGGRIGPRAVTVDGDDVAARCREVLRRVQQLLVDDAVSRNKVAGWRAKIAREVRLLRPGDRRRGRASGLDLVDSRGSAAALAPQTAGVLFDAWGGKIAAVAPDATAFPHRDAAFLAQEFVTFHGPTPTRRWPRTTGGSRPLARFQAGGERLRVRELHRPRAPRLAPRLLRRNLARLVDVKRRYDPGDVFRFAQSIPTTMPA